MATQHDALMDSLLMGGNSNTLGGSRRSTKGGRRSTKGHRRSTYMRRSTFKKQSTLENMNFYVERAYQKEQEQREENEKVMNEFIESRPKQETNYLKFEGLIGEVYQANRGEFEPNRMSRVEEVELLNRILDKLHAYLITVPQVDAVP